MPHRVLDLVSIGINWIEIGGVPSLNADLCIDLFNVLFLDSACYSFNLHMIIRNGNSTTAQITGSQFISWVQQFFIRSCDICVSR